MKMDWKNPEYAEIIRTRMHNLEKLREHPEDLPLIKAYYRENPADFINDWGVTFDPRNAERGLPTYVPFILFPKQREWIAWVVRKWLEQQNGLNEKSRDCGVTWLAISTSCTLCLFYDGLAIGFGSRKSDYVDKIGTFKPILPKGRIFMENLPAEFTGDWQAWRDAPYMRISFPETGSIITGEGGDDIGRGDRASIYFVDEAAHLERPELVDASLSQTTNCRIDMSSVRGMANPFAKKRWGGKIDVFIFDWRDDPRKDQKWYDEQCEKLDPVVVAQEIDRDYNASVSGVVIPGKWVMSAIDARQKLGIAPSGRAALAFDVADEGDDKNAIARTFGIEVLETREWSGADSDIMLSVERVFEYCDEYGISEFDYDADGLGAGVRGDARVINERRTVAGMRNIVAKGFRGSGGVVDPDAIVESTIGSEGDPGRTNQDYFGNRKAQGWWALRRRFQLTHRYVEHFAKHGPCAIPDADDLISISSQDPDYMKTAAELSQATYRVNTVGKMIIDKKGKQKSPNRGDAIMIRFAPKGPEPLNITDGMLQQVAAMGRRRR